jgi:hypothetical protein
LARYLVVVPRPMPEAPRRYLIVVARRLQAAVVCHRSLVVVLRPLPAAPFSVRRRYLIEVPRPFPAAPLAVRRIKLIVVLRPVPRPLPAATRHCRSRRRALGRCAVEQSKYYKIHLHRGKATFAAMFFLPL